MLLFSLNIFLKPVTLNCGHSACQKCIVTLSEISPKCHRCRAPFTANALTVNYTLDTITRELKLKCLSEGCTWSGLYPRAEDHYNECPKLVETCKNASCKHVSTRESMPAHEDVCPKLLLPCGDCKLMIPRDGMQHHRQSTCVNSPVQCPLDCGTVLPRYVDFFTISLVQSICQ